MQRIRVNGRITGTDAISLMKLQKLGQTILMLYASKIAKSKCLNEFYKG